jgi:phage shock protein PspC (stress-responsive transcriptional regulator)
VNRRQNTGALTALFHRYRTSGTFGMETASLSLILPEPSAETAMSSENLFESIRENLNGNPGQPIVLGVCNALAKRHGQEPWIYRAGFILLAVFWTGLTLLVYVALGLMMKETEDRSRGVFQGLFVTLREAVEKCLDACRGLCTPQAGRRNGTRY